MTKKLNSKKFERIDCTVCSTSDCLLLAAMVFPILSQAKYVKSISLTTYYDK